MKSNKRLAASLSLEVEGELDNRDSPFSVPRVRCGAAAATPPAPVVTYLASAMSFSSAPRRPFARPIAALRFVPRPAH